MTNLRKDIEAGLEDQGRYSVKVGARTILLREIRKKYQIQITKDGQSPSVSVYRSRKIALNRFEEQIAYFRRAL